MSTPLDDYITQTLKTLPGSNSDPVNYAQILKERPDVLAEYNQENTRDSKSKTNLQKIGAYNAEDFAKWWYENYGKGEGYTPGSTTPSDTPSTTTPSTTTPSTPAPTTTDAGKGVTTAVPTTKATALAQAQSKAKLAVQGRGLDYGQYGSLLDDYLNGIYNTIPDSDTNPGTYFDPNFADTILNGEETKLQRGYRGEVTSRFGNPNLNYHMLDGTIEELLGGAAKSGQDLLDNGLKRGQFNETGVAAGTTKLASAKEKARSMLNTNANDILSGYSSKYNDLYSQALGAASGAKLGDQFDLSPWQQQYDNLTQSATTDAKGKLYDLIGDQPLINLGDIRGAVGQGQGAINLTDLDVLDGLAKRKQASGVGRGLGSQGAF